MSYRDWKVGDKVVCIKRGKWAADGPQLAIRDPEYNEICEIAGFYLCEDGVYLRLVSYPEWSVYAAARFRPVQPRKTDISVFTALLNTNKQKEPAQ